MAEGRSGTPEGEKAVLGGVKSDDGGKILWVGVKGEEHM